MNVLTEAKIYIVFLAGWLSVLGPAVPAHVRNAAAVACSEEATEVVAERLVIEREDGVVRLVSSRTGELDRFVAVKMAVSLDAAGSAPWQGKDDEGRLQRVAGATCAVKLVFAEESALLYWRDGMGRWQRLWLAD